MGIMEQILEQLKQLNVKIDDLSATAGKGETILIDGKAALGSKETSELTGIGKQNLIDMAKVGKVPHFMNGSYYMFPVKPLFEWMNSEAYRSMKESNETDFEFYKLTS